jgi:hypothetical protein
MEWFADEGNRPSRTDYYLMQVAARVILANAKEGATLSYDDLKINFEPPKESNIKEQPAVQDPVAFSKALIRGFQTAFGGKVTVVEKPKAE